MRVAESISVDDQPNGCRLRVDLRVFFQRKAISLLIPEGLYIKGESLTPLQNQLLTETKGLECAYSTLLCTLIRRIPVFTWLDGFHLTKRFCLQQTPSIQGHESLQQPLPHRVYIHAHHYGDHWCVQYLEADLKTLWAGCTVTAV